VSGSLGSLPLALLPQGSAGNDKLNSAGGDKRV
jgi:hypothetical protein